MMGTCLLDQAPLGGDDAELLGRGSVLAGGDGALDLGLYEALAALEMLEVERYDLLAVLYVLADGEQLLLLVQLLELAPTSIDVLVERGAQGGTLVGELLPRQRVL
jgi:hypothetical protein